MSRTNRALRLLSGVLQFGFTAALALNGIGLPQIYLEPFAATGYSSPNRFSNSRTCAQSFARSVLQSR